MIGLLSSNPNVNSSTSGSLATSPSLNGINSNLNCVNNSVNSNGTNNNTDISQLSYDLISLSTTLQQFETIRKWLTKHHKKYCENDVPSNKALSQFLCQFIQFQEDYLGKNAAKPSSGLTRLPFEVLVDFQPSELCVTCFQLFLNINMNKKYQNSI